MESSDAPPPEAPPDGGAQAQAKKTKQKAPPKPKAAMPPAIGSADVPLLELDAGYDILIMDRRQLEDWPFNPRVMSLESAVKLKAALAGGLLGPACVWNKRNGKLVGGHQRLRQLDGLHGNDVYRLRVIVVDLDEPGHAEACVKLNNFAAMGEWDITKLDAVLKTEGVDIAKTGFNVQDVYLMFGDTGAAMKMGDAAMDLAAAFGRSNDRQTTLLSFTKRRDLGVYFYTTLFWPYGEDRQRAHDAFGWDQSPCGKTAAPSTPPTSTSSPPEEPSPAGTPRTSSWPPPPPSTRSCSPFAPPRTCPSARARSPSSSSTSSPPWPSSRAARPLPRLPREPVGI